MLKLTLYLLAVLTLTACNNRNNSADNAALTTPTGPANRIVSLDYCADQYVLKLVDPSRILAVSPDAVKDFSYMRDAAQGLPSVRARAEDVLLLKPDLIVRSYGGGPGAAAFFERAGVPVLNVGWTPNIDQVKTVILDIANGLAEPERGHMLVTQLQARLDAIPKPHIRREALYMTPSGVTSGSGSLIHDMLIKAGLDNFQKAPGWHSIPLERLAYKQPDLIVTAFFDTQTDYKSAWSAMRHPIARKQLKNRPVIALQGAWTACGSWFLMDAIEALSEVSHDVG